jgi:hypothetical protein
MKPGIMTAEEFDARFSQFYKSTVDLIRKDERSQLLKSLVEEVEGMMGRMRGDTTVEEDVGYENALQDVIKVIKSKE